MDDSQFRQVLEFFGVSWKGYRRVRKGVKKRLARYMQDHEFRGMGAFLSALEKDQGRRDEVERLLTVSISRFFRDWELWRAIGESVLPEIVSAKPPKVKVWSAGCARGEEAYTFKILWEDRRPWVEKMPDLELWATDFNPEYLERARGGIYSAGSLKELPDESRSKYLRPSSQQGFSVTDGVKEGIRWKEHHLYLDAPPARDFSLILLRNNLLTYYRDEIRDLALSRVIDALIPAGFLIIGSHENLPPGFTMLHPFSGHPSIYQKAPAPFCGG